MKVQIIKDTDDDYEATATLCVNNEGLLSIGNMGENPEDASLARDFSWFFMLPELLQSAYKAGQMNEGFEILDTKIDPDSL